MHPADEFPGRLFVCFVASGLALWGLLPFGFSGWLLARQHKLWGAAVGLLSLVAALLFGCSLLPTAPGSDWLPELKALAEGQAEMAVGLGIAAVSLGVALASGFSLGRKAHLQAALLAGLATLLIALPLGYHVMTTPPSTEQSLSRSHP